MKKLRSLLLFLVLLAASCNKDEPENPYKNVVRCKINGVPWEAQCEGNIVFGCEAVDCLFFDSDTSRVLQLYTVGGSTGKKIDLFFYSHYKTGIDNFYSVRNGDIKFADNTYKETCRGFYIDTLKSNMLNIKIDTTNKGDRLGTLTGNFHFTVANTCGDIVKITDGYFRTGYRW